MGYIVGRNSSAPTAEARDTSEPSAMVVEPPTGRDCRQQLRRRTRQQRSATSAGNQTAGTEPRRQRTQSNQPPKLPRRRSPRPSRQRKRSRRRATSPRRTSRPVTGEPAAGRILAGGGHGAPGRRDHESKRSPRRASTPWSRPRPRKASSAFWWARFRMPPTQAQDAHRPGSRRVSRIRSCENTELAPDSPLVQLRAAAARAAAPAGVAAQKRTHFRSGACAEDANSGGLNLHTVCESARCPNMHECFQPRRGDVHDSRQSVHARLRILFGAERLAAQAGIRARSGRAGQRRAHGGAAGSCATW